MFRTELTIAPAAGQLTRTARVLTMGSCFADSIGARLVANKVEARVNPFGTVFQPLALARLLRAAAGEEVDWQRHLVQARGRWQSYDLHGSVGADSPVELLQYIQEVVRQTGDFLRNADVVLLTLGTAWAYRLRETGELVSNCHKQPADLFVRELLTPDEIINALAETHAYLRRLNPNLRFVLTVSPVRHLKDTLQLNAVSKSVLRLATHIVSDLLPGVAYFPAYELLVDDLRDYRFYASDMLHPSEVAEDYIWEKFARAYFDSDFGRFRKEWAAVRQSLGHRPLHEGAPEHRQFLESTREKLEQLSLRKVDVADELRTVRARIAALPVPRQPEPVVELEDDEERIDIGEGSEVSTVVRVSPQASDVAEAAEATLLAATDQATETPARTPRLSPEEFRAQRAARSGRPERGRRDGRGKGQVAQPTENEEFQAASFAQADEFAPQPFLQEAATEIEAVASAAEETPGAPAVLPDALVEEPARKKKRRSRGGAKRTARKNALRLATEMQVTEGQLPASEAALEAAAGAMLPEGRPERAPGQKSSVITKSQPVKRGGRRDDSGRGPRVPLFAAPTAETAPEMPETPMADAEAPVLALTTPLVAIPESLSMPDADVETAPASASSRNSRNRKKKKAARALYATEAPANELPANDELPAENEGVPQLPLANAAELSGAPESTPVVATQPDDSRQPPQMPVAALPVESRGAATAVEAVAVAGAAAPAKPSRRKARAVSGGRTEKPAVDTPIIPVSESTEVRTRVAAGRLMGTSASLVEPEAAVQKPASKAVAKPAAAKSKTVKKTSVTELPAETAAPEAAPTPEVAAPKAKAKAAPKAKKPAEATPETPTPATETDETPAPVKAPRKPTARKPAAAKPGTAPADAAPASEPEEAAKPAAKAPKAAAKKPAAAKAAGTKAAPKGEAKPATKARTSRKSAS
jgi:hypothetical protein